MAARFVTHTGKTSTGEITALGNPREPWSPRSAADVIHDIENGIHSYYTGTVDLERANIVLYSGPMGKYLFTDKDNDGARHLLNLPDIPMPALTPATASTPETRFTPVEFEPISDLLVFDWQGTVLGDRASEVVEQVVAAANREDWWSMGAKKAVVTLLDSSADKRTLKVEVLDALETRIGEVIIIFDG